MSVFDHIHRWLLNIRDHRGWGWAVVAAGLAAFGAWLVWWLVR